MTSPLKKVFIPFLSLLLMGSFFFSLQAQESTLKPSRFIYRGDGSLVLQGQTIVFRNAQGAYQEAALKKIHQLFKANWQEEHERLSLRFIEMMDYLQDQLNGGNYTLRSGYRSPKNNQGLRNQGKLAAQSSMHIEGAAADLKLSKVASSQVFEYVKNLNCCGIGWYGSAHFHLDTGPARYWGATTSKTEDKTPQQNAKIILQSDFDIYYPGEKIDLKFMRITQFPIGVPAQISLVKLEENEAPQKIAELALTFPSEVSKEEACPIIQTRAQARKIFTQLPQKLKAGSYAISVKFCNRYNYQKMPESILSRSFQIKEK